MPLFEMRKYRVDLAHWGTRLVCVRIVVRDERDVFGTMKDSAETEQLCFQSGIVRR